MSERDSAPRISFGQRASGIVENTINSIRVAPQWHIPGVISGVGSGFSGYQTVERLLDGKVVELIPATLVTLALVIAFYFNEEMAAIYFNDYKKLKKSLKSHGWDERIVWAEGGSFCGRRAAKTAATDAGYSQEFNTYIRKHKRSYKSF